MNATEKETVHDESCGGDEKFINMVQAKYCSRMNREGL